MRIKEPIFMQGNCRGIFLVLTLAAVVFYVSGYAQSPRGYQYPAIVTENVVDTFFHRAVADPYRFLELSEDLRTRKFIADEEQFTNQQIKEMGKFRFFKERLSTKIFAKYNPLTFASKQGKYFFALRHMYFDDGYSLYFGNSIDLVDRRAFAPEDYKRSRRDNVSITEYKPSSDDKYVAVAIAHSGSDWEEIKIVNLETRETLADEIKWVRFSQIYWKGNGFFYCRYDEPKWNEELTGAIKNRKLYYHKIGAEQASDSLIYGAQETDVDFFPFWVSPDATTLFIQTKTSIKGKRYNAILTRNLDAETGNFTPLLTWPSSAKIFYELIGKDGSKVYLKSNYQGFNKCVMEMDITKKNAVTILIPAMDNPLTNVTLINKRIICSYSDGYKTTMAIYDLIGNLLSNWRIPDGAALGGMYGDPKDAKVFYNFESFYYPSSFYVADLNTYTRKPVSGAGILYNTDNIITEFVNYTSKDGTQVPMYITYRKGIKKDGSNPCLMYGYGGHGISVTPEFDPVYQVLYDNRCIVAVPCIRGGGEKDGWHEAGKKLNKQNSFDDFIAAAEFLIRERYTSSSRLAINGASNGGLLVASVMLQRPDLFKAVVSEVGVYDMLRYQHFTGGNLWRDEYGLSSDSVEFVHLMKYSPLHNIGAAVDYPASLIIAGENDDRVPPSHSYKFVATLQNKAGKKNPYLLYLKKNAGHSGSASYEDRLEREAFKLAFIFNSWGIDRKLSRKN